MTQPRFSLRTFNRSPPSCDAASSFHPQPAPPHFDTLTFLYLSWKSAKILSGRPRAQTPAGTQEPKVFKQLQDHVSVWVIVSLGGDILLSHVNSKGTQNHTLVRKEQGKSLCCCRPPLPSYHQPHISYKKLINEPITDVSGAVLRWRPIMLLIESYLPQTAKRQFEPRDQDVVIYCSTYLPIKM